MAVGLGTLTLDLVAKIGNYTAPLSKAEQQTKATTQRISADMGKASAAVDLLGNSASKTSQILGSLVATAGIGFSVSELIKYSDTYTGLNNRLKLVTTSETQLATAVKDTFEIAQKSRSSWETTAAIYQRFAQNSDRLGLSQERVASITETVSKAVAISGASTESANAAMMQFGQALASGVLRGEEFNSVNEQTPAILDAIAKGLGVQRAALKSMAEEGELTTDVLIKALEKADESVQDLFGKTDVTIGQSFTYLNNEITKFVGESGKGSGAATALSSSVMVLANNLDLLTNAAMVGGAYLAGSYISSLVATTVASAKNTLATAANTAATKTKILADYELAKAELAASAAMVRSMGATNAETAALVANSRAAYQKAAASKAAMLSSASLLGVLGGPVGLGLTVAGVAASYLLMQDNADKVNKKLEEQASIADRTASELNKLTGVDRKSAINDLTAAFEAQNKALDKSRLAVGSALIDIQNYEKGNWKVVEVINQANKGTISYNDAIKQLNSMKISPDLYNALKKQVEQYDSNFEKANKSATALGVFGKEVVLTGNAAQNAALQHKQQNDALNETATAADKANDALTKYRDKLKESAISGLYKQGLFEQGYSPSQANAIFELQQARGMSAILSKEEIASALNVLKITEQTTKAEQAYNDRIKQGNDSLKKRESERAKAAEEDRRLREKQFQDREDIYYKYASREMKIEKDLQSEIAKIQASNFSPKDTAGYISNAQSRSQLEVLLYKAQLDSELNDWKQTEQEKLNHKVYVNELMIQLDSDMNKEQKKQAIQSLIGRSNQELAWIRLQQRQRISDASEAFRTDMENIAARYAFEREQILLNKSISDEERKALLNASVYTQNKDESQVRDSAIADYRDVMGFEESPLVRQFEVLQKMRELDLINEEAYQNAKLQLQAKSTAGYMEGMLGGFASLVDENSKTYAVLFAAQKAFAVAQAMLNIPSAYSKAYDAVVGTPFVGPYIAPAVGAAAAALQVAQAASIKSVSLTGMAHNGIDNIPKEGTWLLDGGERVLNPEQNKDLTRYLNDRQSANTQNQPMESPQVNVRVMNSWDDSEYYNALAAPQGEKIVMNIIKRNRTKLGI